MFLNKKTVIVIEVFCGIIILTAFILNSVNTPQNLSVNEPYETSNAQPTVLTSVTPQPTVTSSVTPTNDNLAVSNNTEKGLLFLNAVVGLDLTKYSVTSQETQNSNSNEGASSTVDFKLTAIDKELTVLVGFVNGNVQAASVLEMIGQPYLVNPASSNPVVYAKSFLTHYAVFTNNPDYAELATTLDSIGNSQTFNQTVGNAHLEFTNYNGESSFRWYYTANGVSAEYSKVFGMTFRSGFLYLFSDNWQTYSIGNNNVNISEQQARTIALQTTENYNWGTTVDKDAFDPENFNDTNVKWDSLLFIGALDNDTAHSGGSLTLYPVWRVGVALDKWYGDMYGLQVEIWADNGQVRSTEQAWSMMEP